MAVVLPCLVRPSCCDYSPSHAFRESATSAESAERGSKLKNRAADGLASMKARSRLTRTLNAMPSRSAGTVGIGNPQGWKDHVKRPLCIGRTQKVSQRRTHGSNKFKQGPARRCHHRLVRLLL